MLNMIKLIVVPFEILIMCNFSKEQYEFAKKRIEDLIDIAPDCHPEEDPAALELSIMAEIVMEYEEEHFSIREDIESLKEKDAQGALTLV